MSSAFERVVETSQRVVTKHIDLALLEARAALTHMLLGLVAVNSIVVLGCGAWFALAAAAAAACFTGTTARLLLFGLINACGAILAGSALRWARWRVSRP